MKAITLSEIQQLAKDFGLKTSRVQAIKEVESGGIGFDSVTGKIIIQFEPAWYKKMAPYTPSGKWSLNGVERQKQEWIAFNDAYFRSPDAAMQATSIGLMQVMGFHYKRLGFSSVGEMWTFAKQSEKNQLWLGLEFLRTDKIIFKALIDGNWKVVAKRYNGAAYWKLGYDKKLMKADLKYS